MSVTARFQQLPEPIRLEETITSEDVYEAEPTLDLIVDAWLLKNAAG
ncbi:MAG: hypothetical protein WB767_14160 [Nocardioides sp.]